MAFFQNINLHEGAYEAWRLGSMHSEPQHKLEVNGQLHSLVVFIPKVRAL